MMEREETAPGLKGNILRVFFANIIVVLLGLLSGFLLPKYLSAENYALIRRYQLYITYAGVLHFGYVDGMYLRYGGQDLNALTDRGFAESLSTMRIFQSVVCLLLLIPSLISGRFLMTAFVLSVLPVNLYTYYSFLYQATDRFSLYGRIMSGMSAGMFGITLLLLFAGDVRNPQYYIAAYVIVYYLVWWILEWLFLRRHRPEKGRLFSFAVLRENIARGLPLMLGGLAALFLVNMDQWFVLWSMPPAVYALYAFAANVNGLMMNAITPVTTTLYPYFCRETETVKRQHILCYVVIFASVLPLGAFPVCLILEHFLPAYLGAGYVIRLLFAAGMLYALINAVYVNLYKAEGRVLRYFAKLLIPLAFGLSLNAASLLTEHPMEWHTVITLLTYLIWLVIVLLDFKSLRMPVRAALCFAGEMALFLCTAFLLSTAAGFLVYAAGTACMLLLLMRPVLKEVRP